MGLRRHLKINVVLPWRTNRFVLHDVILKTRVKCGHYYFSVLSCQNLKVRRLGFTCAGWWFVAVLFWVNDRVFCDIWRSVSFPYLHCAWHILIFIAGYTGCVLGAYFYAAREFPQLHPALTFWPCWSSEWGVPYIVLRGIPKEGNPWENVSEKEISGFWTTANAATWNQGQRW